MYFKGSWYAEENENEVLVKDYEDNKNEVDLEDGGSIENINGKVIHHEIIDDKIYFSLGYYKYVVVLIFFRDTPGFSSRINSNQGETGIIDYTTSTLQTYLPNKRKDCKD